MDVENVNYVVLGVAIIASIATLWTAHSVIFKGRRILAFGTFLDMFTGTFAGIGFARAVAGHWPVGRQPDVALINWIVLEIAPFFGAATTILLAVGAIVLVVSQRTKLQP